MTKNIYKVLVIVIAVGSVLSGCVEQKKDSVNYFGGTGDIQYCERVNGRNVLYDDENIYITFKHEALLRLDKNNELNVNCMIATCLHDTQECKAAVNAGEYFIFNNKLYRFYNESSISQSSIIYSGFIKDCQNNDIVFDNPVPEEMDEGKKIDDSTEIYYVRVINEDYLKVEGHRHAYILDKNFEVICMYDDVGKFPWGTLYEDKYYYINDLYQLVNVNIKTGESEVIELENNCFLGGAYKDYIFYSDEFEDLYRYSLKDKEKCKISEKVAFFSIYDGYIYAEGGQNKNKRIMDINGNLIKDYTEYTNMVCSDSFIKIRDMIYCTYENGIAMMKEDGSDYKEIVWEQGGV
ncbi:MAG: hypothetical protein IJC76_00285 [Lachnospiraceae bacterium]|nr:hypothetical protein [Lachnospiraceae bacterium]